MSEKFPGTFSTAAKPEKGSSRTIKAAAILRNERVFIVESGCRLIWSSEGSKRHGENEFRRVDWERVWFSAPSLFVLASRVPDRCANYEAFLPGTFTEANP